MLVCIDLSRLYFILKKVRCSLDYSKFVNFLRSLSGDPNVQIVGFTIADKSNKRQTSFLRRLEGMGIKLHVYPTDTRPSFTMEMVAIAGLSPKQNVVFVTDDVALISVFEILQARGKNCGLAFFSTELSGRWIPHFLQGTYSLFDLGEEKTLAEISAPLPNRGRDAG